MFDQQCTQDDIFHNVAKGVIDKYVVNQMHLFVLGKFLLPKNSVSILLGQNLSDLFVESQKVIAYQLMLDGHFWLDKFYN